MSSHRGCTSKSRTSFRRAFEGTGESLIISASKKTYPCVRQPVLDKLLDNHQAPFHIQTTASPAQSTSAFRYVNSSHHRQDTNDDDLSSLLARQTAPVRPRAKWDMKLRRNEAAHGQ